MIVIQKFHVTSFDSSVVMTIKRNAATDFSNPACCFLLLKKLKDSTAFKALLPYKISEPYLK
jgi:hypothetical protein